MKLRFWLLLAGCLIAGPQAVAQYGPGPIPYMGGPAASPQAEGAALVLREGMDKLLGFLDAEESPSAEALARFLNDEIAPYFDFEHMAESAGGRLYQQLEEQEQQAMVEDIKRTFLITMTEKLTAYDNQQVRFLPSRGSFDDRTAQVSVAVLNPGSYPARLDFRLYRDADNWRVYDVAANGQSAIVHYRRQLMREFQRRQMRQIRRMAPPLRHGGMVPPGFRYLPPR